MRLRLSIWSPVRGKYGVWRRADTYLGDRIIIGTDGLIRIDDKDNKETIYLNDIDQFSHINITTEDKDIKKYKEEKNEPKVTG